MNRNMAKSLLWASLILSGFLLIGCRDGLNSSRSAGAGSGGGDTGGVTAAAIELGGGSGDPEAAAAAASTEAPIAEGGSGGSMQLYSRGDLRILSEGTVDASFTVPEIENDFGELHYTVTGDETVALDPKLPITGIYVETYSESLYLDDGYIDTRPQAVTGLTVPAGATLRLPDTYDGDQWAYLWFNNDIVINGTVTTTDEETGIELETDGNIIIGETGLITTEATTAGSNGGDIELYAYGVAVNQGTLIADGADGDSETGGGYAGNVEIDADGDVYNTGTLSANGGDHADGDAGSGNSIYLYSYYGSTYTSGPLMANGGMSTGVENGGDGGDGGYIYLCTGCYLEERFAGEEIILPVPVPLAPPQLVVSGVLSNNGGDAENGNGGNAGENIELYNNGAADGSNVVINAALSSRGGNAVGGNGGYGYGINVYVSNGGASIAGTMDVAGGDGIYGGDGGWIEVYTDGVGQPLELVGIESIAMDGGDGDYGASGGYVSLYTYALPPDTYPLGSELTELTAGAIEVDAPISVNGGTGIFAGGTGGQIEMYTSYELDMSDETTVITNTAAHSAAGGDSDGTGGDGGEIYFQSSGGPTVDEASEEHDVSGGAGDESGSEGSVEYDDGPWT